jgi:hypothetical protein
MIIGYNHGFQRQAKFTYIIIVTRCQQVIRNRLIETIFMQNATLSGLQYLSLSVLRPIYIGIFLPGYPSMYISPYVLEFMRVQANNFKVATETWQYSDWLTGWMAEGSQFESR